MSRTELRSSAKKYVEQAVSKSGRSKPSQTEIKRAVDQVVKAFAPVVLKETR